MKRLFSPLVVFVALLAAPTLIVAQDFVNLDFESPIPPLNPDAQFTVPITNALPGWTGYIGASQIDRVFYNTVSLGAAAISFHGLGSLYPAYNSDNSVILQVQFPGGDPSAAIGQTGQIPLSAR